MVRKKVFLDYLILLMPVSHEFKSKCNKNDRRCDQQKVERYRKKYKKDRPLRGVFEHRGGFFFIHSLHFSLAERIRAHINSKISYI